MLKAEVTHLRRPWYDLKSLGTCEEESGTIELSGDEKGPMEAPEGETGFCARASG